MLGTFFPGHPPSKSGKPPHPLPRLSHCAGGAQHPVLARVNARARACVRASDADTASGSVAACPLKY
eukprot:scaffold3852_cov402-Prasinococcus_capsulatus_cf.AAC.5